MNFTFLLTLLLFFFTNAFGNDEFIVHNFNDETNCKIILNSYKDAFNKADIDFIKKYSLSQDEYDLVLKSIVEKKLECLNEFDKTYKMQQLTTEFSEAIKEAVPMDTVVFTSKTTINGCGNTKFVKINASASFKNKSLELPFSLVFMETEKEYYKLIIQILNYKILTNE